MTVPHAADQNQVLDLSELPGTRGSAAGLIVRDGHVLLVERTGSRPWPWVLPGGIIETGESPRAACRRELQEELALDPLIHALAVVDWVPADATQTAALHWVFLASLPDGGRIRLPAEELHRCRWIAPAETSDYLPPHATRRIHAALAAADTGTAWYLEHGRPVLPETFHAH